MATKPYTSGAAYTHRMSDFCMPFMARHRERFEHDPRRRGTSAP